MDKRAMKGLAMEIVDLKAQEEMAKARRHMLEARLAGMIATRDEGTDRAEAGPYRITVTSKLTRSLDYETYQRLEAGIPEGLRCVKMKPELDMKALRAMDMARPGFSAQFITTKPAKPSVKIETMKEAA